ncbi:MAG: TolC family protein [Oligoflexia bacterium]|nr:TolC family protein [Oligoflexia bacterium]
MKALLIILLVNFPYDTYSKETFSLSEKSILGLLENSPETSRLESELLFSKAEFNRASDRFQYTVDANAKKERSQQDAIIPNFPPTSKASTWSATLNKTTKYGMNFGVGYASQRQSNNFLADASTRQFVGKISVDLFRDFLGRSSNSQLKSAKLNYEVAKIQRKLGQKALEFRVRSIYWNYIAAKESRDFAQKMYKSSKDQLKLIKRKKRSDVADDGDIARFASLVSERQAQSLQFEGLLRQYEAELGQIFPSLVGKEINIAPYSKELMLNQIYQCLSVVGKGNQYDKKHTLFDELFDHKRKRLQEQKRLLSAYSDVDVRLEGQVGLIGAGVGEGNAHSNLTDEKNTFNSVGLTISIPIDGKRKTTEKTQLQLAKAQVDAEVRGQESNLESLHSILAENIKLIKEIIQTRSINDNHLEKALKDSRKKFRQARITSQQLVQEEDRYLSNAIQLISTQRDILLFMFDYLSLFTEAPCELKDVK